MGKAGQARLIRHLLQCQAPAGGHGNADYPSCQHAVFSSFLLRLACCTSQCARVRKAATRSAKSTKHKTRASLPEPSKSHAVQASVHIGSESSTGLVHVPGPLTHGVELSLHCLILLLASCRHNLLLKRIPRSASKEVGIRVPFFLSLS